MMKKRMACLLLLCCLLMPRALAQNTTIEETLHYGELEETRMMTLFESMYGYTLWYEADSLAYVAPTNGENVDLFRSGEEKGAQVTFSVTMLARTPGETADAVWEAQIKALSDDGYMFFARGKHTLKAVKDGTTLEMTLKEAARANYLLVAECPSEKRILWEARLKRMEESFLAQPALRASYVGDAPFVTPVDTVERVLGGEKAVIWSDEPLASVALYTVKVENGQYQKDALIKKLSFKALTEGLLLLDTFGISPMLYAEYSDYEGNAHSALISRAPGDARLVVSVL